MAKKPTEGTPPPATPSYEIVGLRTAESMPIEFRGRVFDLANLTAEEAAYLLGFPEQVPYLKTNVSEPATGAADV